VNLAGWNVEPGNFVKLTLQFYMASIITASPESATAVSQQPGAQTYRGPFVIMTILFFM
jgi:hypothetical protein